MKENTKYNEYRFVGKINVDEIQPWFDFASSKPWDEGEIEWILDNKVRREILIRLADGPKSIEEIYKNLNFSPKPLLISEEEHECSIFYQWNKETIENHLMNLEWYNLIKLKNDKYELTFPILNLKKSNELENYVHEFAKNWMKIITELKTEISENLSEVVEKGQIYDILVDKAVRKLYTLLKKEQLIPQEPNIKALWAEQLRKIKFKEWIERSF